MCRIPLASSFVFYQNLFIKKYIFHNYVFHWLTFFTIITIIVFCTFATLYITIIFFFYFCTLSSVLTVTSATNIWWFDWFVFSMLQSKVSFCTDSKQLISKKNGTVFRLFIYILLYKNVHSFEKQICYIRTFIVIFILYWRHFRMKLSYYKFLSQKIMFHQFSHLFHNLCQHKNLRSHTCNMDDQQCQYNFLFHYIIFNWRLLNKPTLPSI